MSDSDMRLFVAVINDPEKLDDILAGFVEHGITGATILNSEGMGHVLSHDIPIFAGLRTLISGSRPQNRLLLSVIRADLAPVAVALIRDVCGDLDSPATGIAFTIPIDSVHGLAPELGNDAAPL